MIENNYSSEFESDNSYDSQNVSKIQKQKKENEGDILLFDATYPLRFFTLIGICFLIQFGIFSLVCLLITYDGQFARDSYWLYRLQNMHVVNLLIVIVLKCIAAFIQNSFYYLGHFVFIIDLAFSHKIIFGLYFYFNEYLQTMYIHNGHYVLLFCYIGFFNSFAYIFSTLFYRKNNYNFALGFCTMELTTMIVCTFHKANNDIMTMGMTKYYLVYFIWTIINLYITLDTYLILNNRSKNYKLNDYVYGYYAIWCDWFSFFWLDLFEMLTNKKSNPKENNSSEEESYDSDIDDDRLSQSFQQGDNEIDYA